jgi:transposase
MITAPWQPARLSVRSCSDDCGTPYRRNWLFAGSDKGGQTAAVLMSLCTTCKELGIDPQAYLRDVLGRISTHPARRIDELLPDRWQELRRAGDAAPD